MIKKIFLFGYGNVGREFVGLLLEKGEDIYNKYGIRLILCGVSSSQGTVFAEEGLDLKLLYQCGKGSEALKRYSNQGNIVLGPHSLYKGDIVVEAAPTDIDNGQPGLDIIFKGIEHGMDIVAISKGALVTNFKNIMGHARSKNVLVKYSGATAAALPTIDIGQYSLAGCRIQAIEGILNGTTNYILTKMHNEEIPFEIALEQAKERGIAESNSDLDIKGIDSACKILLLANSLLDGELSLQDVRIQGIQDITKSDVRMAKEKGRMIKLMARAVVSDNKVAAEVKPEAIDASHLLSNIHGTNKGIVFDTDTMGCVAVLGGASNPKGAAAAALKDVIHIALSK